MHPRFIILYSMALYRSSSFSSSFSSIYLDFSILSDRLFVLLSLLPFLPSCPLCLRRSSSSLLLPFSLINSSLIPSPPLIRYSFFFFFKKRIRIHPSLRRAAFRRFQDILLESRATGCNNMPESRQNQISYLKLIKSHKSGKMIELSQPVFSLCADPLKVQSQRKEDWCANNMRSGTSGTPAAG